MLVRLTQIDGKLPNLALMKLAHWHKAQGHEVRYTKDIEPDDLFERRRWDRVYGSAIFSFSADRVARFRENFPEAIVGGTYNIADNRTVEQELGLDEYENYDYAELPPNKDGETFQGSIGFTQRGCRLKCGFCVVPKKEGKARNVNTVADIWRGETTPQELTALKRAREQVTNEEARKRLDAMIATQAWPRELHLLDNDFFGQPREQWQARLDEIRRGNFKVCFNQGINTRMIDNESAEALASIKLYDDSFRYPRLYTAWDNLGDEERFFRGVNTLERAGIRPNILLVYMLVGYDKRETWERLFYRFARMVERGIRPYPMIFGDRHRALELGNLGRLEVMLSGRRRTLIGDPNDAHLRVRTLNDFQRWAIRKYYTVIPFEHYDSKARDRLARAEDGSWILPPSASGRNFEGEASKLSTSEA